jgi:hypothetical protein
MAIRAFTVAEHRSKRLTDPYERPRIAKNWVKCAALLALLALGGCAGPQFVQNPERGIELRWPNGAGDIQEAQQDAGTRCPGGTAALGYITSDQDETLVRFYCR